MIINIYCKQTFAYQGTELKDMKDALIDSSKKGNTKADIEQLNIFNNIKCIKYKKKISQMHINIEFCFIP